MKRNQCRKWRVESRRGSSAQDISSRRLDWSDSKKVVLGSPSMAHPHWLSKTLCGMDYTVECGEMGRAEVWGKRVGRTKKISLPASDSRRLPCGSNRRADTGTSTTGPAEEYEHMEQSGARI